MNFITVATPHLGSKGNKQVPFLFGVPFFERAACYVIHLIFRRNGWHFFLLIMMKGSLHCCRAWWMIMVTFTLCLLCVHSDAEWYILMSVMIVSPSRVFLLLPSVLLLIMYLVQSILLLLYLFFITRFQLRYFWVENIINQM